MKTQFLRFDGTLEHDPAIEAWLDACPAALAALACEWFTVMRTCGDEVREVFHDGGANACLGDVPFAYVAVFTEHVNVGFFQGASLPDPERLLQGAGKAMRHIKLRPGAAIDAAYMVALIRAAYVDVKQRVEHG